MCDLARVPDGVLLGCGTSVARFVASGGDGGGDVPISRLSSSSLMSAPGRPRKLRPQERRSYDGEEADLVPKRGDLVLDCIPSSAPIPWHREAPHRKFALRRGAARSAMPPAISEAAAISESHTFHFRTPGKNQRHTCCVSIHTTSNQPHRDWAAACAALAAAPDTNEREGEGE